MPSISVVIICKNEVAAIGKTLKSLEGLTDDIIVYDNGSTDGTIELLKTVPVKLVQGSWEGFGKTKAKAIAIAKYDWILSVDADEAIDDELKQSLNGLRLDDPAKVYELKFKNFIGNTYLRFGEWGGDKHIRLFNRLSVKWNDAPVHEQLIMPANVEIKKLDGHILHQTVNSMEDYASKTVKYAMLNAQKYFQQGKKASWFKINLAPRFTFFLYYILKLGVLDGYAGYICAKMTAHYTFLKYTRLRELTSKKE